MTIFQVGKLPYIDPDQKELDFKLGWVFFFWGGGGKNKNSNGWSSCSPRVPYMIHIYMYMYIYIHPPVNIQKAIEHGHRNSELSHEKWVEFP